jgi:2-polyprenyl-3-methyl-5-hydroxy-6-metoxy-1,4-benzoquinol methylase
MHKLPKLDPNSRDFDLIYTDNDPWMVLKSPFFDVHVNLLKGKIKDCDFQRGIDIGCGSGILTNAIHVAKELDGIDYSNSAIELAKSLRSDINFYVLDMRSLNQIPTGKYDVVTCFEVLYYIDSHDAKRNVSSEISRIGSDKCIYFFSLVTCGDLNDRNYFNYYTAVSFLSEIFEILETQNWTLHDEQFSFPNKVIKKLLSFSEALRTKYLLRLMGSANHESSFQTLFICRQKRHQICTKFPD